MGECHVWLPCEWVCSSANVSKSLPSYVRDSEPGAGLQELIVTPRRRASAGKSERSLGGSRSADRFGTELNVQPRSPVMSCVRATGGGSFG